MTVYSFEANIPINILKMIAIYATGTIIKCQNDECNKLSNEVLVMSSQDTKKQYFYNRKVSDHPWTWSSFQRCNNKNCNALLICCKKKDELANKHKDYKLPLAPISYLCHKCYQIKYKH